MILTDLFEMAKGKTKRAKEAKNARKRKAENPTMDDQRNLVAVNAQTSGAGAHEEKTGRNASRTRQKRQWKKEAGI